MLVVPGKSHIFHHSSPPAHLCSALVSTVCARCSRSVFRVCFAPLVSHDRHHRNPVLSYRGALLCSNRTPGERKLRTAVDGFQPPRTAATNALCRFSNISLFSVTIIPSRERMDCEYVDGLADRNRLLFAVLSRE